MENKFEEIKRILKDKGSVKTRFCFSKDTPDTCNVEIEIEKVNPKEIAGISKQPTEYHVKLKYEIYHRTFLGEDIYKEEEIEKLFKDFEKLENI